MDSFQMRYQRALNGSECRHNGYREILMPADAAKTFRITQIGKEMATEKSIRKLQRALEGPRMQ